MSWFQGRNRGRTFLRFVVAVIWTIAAYVLSERAAHTLSQGVVFPLIRDLFAILLFIVGYSYMEMAWDRARDPLRAMGFVARPGALREFGLGAALGWGMVTAFTFVVLGLGEFYIRISSTSRAWEMLILQVCILAAGSLAAEIAFRGYPFQKLIETTGPFAATVLAGLFFGIVRAESPVAAPVAADWVSGVAAVVLAVAYLRTRALWLCWGLHFTWLASIGILFGQPLAGSRQASSVIATYADGPAWLTGSEYGPQGSVVALAILWVGLLLLFLLTGDLARKYGWREVRIAGFPTDIRSFAPAAVDVTGYPQPQSSQPGNIGSDRIRAQGSQPGDIQPRDTRPGDTVSGSSIPDRPIEVPATPERTPGGSSSVDSSAPEAVSIEPLSSERPDQEVSPARSSGCPDPPLEQ